MATTEKKDTLFDRLQKINVNEHCEKKRGSDGKELTYLSWCWAWQVFKRECPDATYKIYRDPVTNLPYSSDPVLGYMVGTSITAEGQTYEMWLPVMDSKNKAMKAEAYQYSTKYGAKSVEQASMFDVNTAIMRCLVKNMAMFGLGLYIYAGEDLPKDDDGSEKGEINEGVQKQKMEQLLTGFGCDLSKVAAAYGYSSWAEVPLKDAEDAYRKKASQIASQKQERKLA